MAELAFLLPNLRGGGVQKVVSIVASAMIERGHGAKIVVLGEAGELKQSIDPRIEIMTLQRSNQLVARITAALADVHGIGKLRRHLLEVKNRSKTLPYLPGLSRFLSEYRPDTLFAATPYLNMDAILARRHSKTDLRVVVSERSHLSSGKPRKLWRAKRLHNAMSHCYRQADAIVAVSHGVADDLAQTLNLDRNSISVIHNPTVLDNAAELASQPVDDPWFNESTIPVLLSIGRPSYQKDYETLVRALGIVNQRTPVRWAVIGSVANTKKRERTVKKLRDLASDLDVADKIRFLGWNPTPFPYIARATALVLSSRWEGLPNVLLEALACGTPIVSTDCPSGPAEILADGEFGELVPVEDPEAMAQSILKVVAGPNDRERLKQRAEEFDRKSSLDSYEKILTG